MDSVAFSLSVFGCDRFDSDFPFFTTIASGRVFRSSLYHVVKGLYLLLEVSVFDCFARPGVERVSDTYHLTGQNASADCSRSPLGYLFFSRPFTAFPNPVTTPSQHTATYPESVGEHGISIPCRNEDSCVSSCVRHRVWRHSAAGCAIKAAWQGIRSIS